MTRDRRLRPPTLLGPHIAARVLMPAALLALAACSTTPIDPAAPAPVVSRTAANTTWSSPNAGAAAPTPAATAPTTPQSRVATVDTARGVVASAGASGGAAAAAAPAAAAIAAPALRAPAERLVFFDFDSFAIRDEFKAMLEGHARVLAARRDQRLVIEGHTDERGGREYNLALGQKRAEAVLRSLALLGAGEGQMEAVSFGKERLVNSTGNEAAMAQNRRAELKDR